MILIELTASVLTIMTIYLLAHADRDNLFQVYGCFTGLTGQAVWLYIIFAQELYGLLLADSVVFILYLIRINKLMRGSLHE
jgi:hypothetical protein